MRTPDAERMRRHRARMYEAGFHYVNGRLVKGPKRGPHPVPPHGTPRRYLSRSHPCRCTECRAAFAARQREQRARRRERERHQ